MEWIVLAFVFSIILIINVCIVGGFVFGLMMLWWLKIFLFWSLVFPHFSDGLEHLFPTLRFGWRGDHGFVVVFVWSMIVLGRKLTVLPEAELGVGNWCLGLFHNYFLTVFVLCRCLFYDMFIWKGFFMTNWLIRDIFFRRWLNNASLNGLLNFEIDLRIIHGKLFNGPDISEAFASKCMRFRCFVDLRVMWMSY